MLVKQAMCGEVKIAKPDQTIRDAARQMRVDNIGALGRDLNSASDRCFGPKKFPAIGK